MFFLHIHTFVCVMEIKKKTVLLLKSKERIFRRIFRTESTIYFQELLCAMYLYFIHQ
jgi:hypothetical protein